MLALTLASDGFRASTTNNNDEERLVAANMTEEELAAQGLIPLGDGTFGMVDEPVVPPPGLEDKEKEEGSDRLRRHHPMDKSQCVQVVPLPDTPSEEEQCKCSAMGHSESASWCEACIAGRGREARHMRVNQVKRDVAHVFFDYGYLTLGGGELKLPDRPDEPRYVLMMVAVDQTSGEVFATACVRKGKTEKYASEKLGRWLERLGHPRVIITCDSERALVSMAKYVVKETKKQRNVQVCCWECELHREGVTLQMDPQNKQYS
eukprot:1387340-Amphidinium_carterae.3